MDSQHRYSNLFFIFTLDLPEDPSLPLNRWLAAMHSDFPDPAKHHYSVPVQVVVPKCDTRKKDPIGLILLVIILIKVLSISISLFTYNKNFIKLENNFIKLENNFLIRNYFNICQAYFSVNILQCWHIFWYIEEFELK